MTAASKSDSKTTTSWSLVPTIAKGVGVFGVLIAALLSIQNYVDARVAKQLANPETLRSLARQVRPALVFDSHGRILADLGALDYIETVEVLPGDGSLPIEIIVQPKEFMPAAPFVEAINDPSLAFHATRARGIAWSFSLEDQGGFSSGADEPQFRLEILHGSK